jgi:NADH-quinone oxidoreductase subunit H
MKLGLMLLSEYAHMLTVSFLMSILFFGGWTFFGLESITGSAIGDTLIRFAILGTKMFSFVMLFLLVRWTIPRFRFDQLMNLAWKVMIPLGLANVVCVVFALQLGAPLWVLTAASVVLFLAAGVIAVRVAGSITNPKRAVRKLPPGMPVGVGYAGR